MYEDKKGTFSKRNFLVKVSVLQHDHGNPICLGHFVFHDTRIIRKVLHHPLNLDVFLTKIFAFFEVFLHCGEICTKFENLKK
jgi:hypothetical protein